MRATPAQDPLRLVAAAEAEAWAVKAQAVSWQPPPAVCAPPTGFAIRSAESAAALPGGKTVAGIELGLVTERPPGEVPQRVEPHPFVQAPGRAGRDATQVSDQATKQPSCRRRPTEPSQRVQS